MYIYAGNDHFTAITNKINAEHHSHKMLQISISFEEELCISIDENQKLCKGFIIDSNINHSLYCKEENQILFLFDKTSTVGEQIKQNYLKNQPYRIIDDCSVNKIRELLKSYFPILDKETYLEFYKRFLEALQITINIDLVLDERIVWLLNEIKRCTNTHHSLEEMAKSVFLSKSRLSHLFKKETGLPLSSYIVLHKLQKAMLKIFLGDSITNAAITAGFDSPSHFASVCKKTLGMSAREISQDSVFLKVNVY